MNCGMQKDDRNIFQCISMRSSDAGNSSYECRSEQLHAANSWSMRIIDKQRSFKFTSIYIAFEGSSSVNPCKPRLCLKYEYFLNACHMIVINAQIYAHHFYAWHTTAYPALEKDSQRAQES